LNGALVSAVGAAAGATSAAAPTAAPHSADTFTGYGGVGDYARANGNTWPVMQSAHRLRDGGYGEAAIAAAVPTGKFDLVVVGGGIAGLSAARRFRQIFGSKARILLLENHAIVGGEARQNEFDVDGVRLMAPQGSNDFAVPPADSRSAVARFFEEFAIPRDYQWQSWDSGLKPLRFAHDNYSSMAFLRGFARVGRTAMAPQHLEFRAHRHALFSRGATRLAALAQRFRAGGRCGKPLSRHAHLP
jgi:spermidine dehydrogenase